MNNLIVSSVEKPQEGKVSGGQLLAPWISRGAGEIPTKLSSMYPLPHPPSP